MVHQFLKTFTCVLITLTVFLNTSCKTNSNIVANDFKEEFFDTLFVDGNNPDFWSGDDEIVSAKESPYQGSAKRSFDLLHTRIRVSFDWEKEYVYGDVDVIVSPLFYPQNELELDAKNFEILEIKDNYSEEILSYKYDGLKLVIALKKFYLKGEKVDVKIKYIAKPSEGQIGGSQAITSDKGLFFINPKNEEFDKPMQIWTQGETENNSRWFPTFDKPNERCTEEIYITVDQRFSTLSNGILKSSVENKDGTRTDYWRQDKPHAPYLFMLAIGEFSWVVDQWRGIPLYYIVERKYESSAKNIFKYTPEMLEYFSTLLDYAFPWDKYAQIVTRDYVSGAMENTTAVIFGEFVQKSNRALIDNGNDNIVAHEMFHHWFGDLVTCESWSNLTLNEGFANYAEYLWTEHKYGKTEADQHLMEEEMGYLQSSYDGNLHPLIFYHYEDKEDMFDAHSYNKGGLVLHYLRNYVGDDAFFAALNNYLKTNEYRSVEVDNLRLAFEEVTGEDLHWFFNQWYLEKGHVEMSVHYDYDEENHQVLIYTDQQGENVFKTYFDVAIVRADESITYNRVWSSAINDTLIITDVKSKPLAICLDGKGIVPGTVNETKTQDEWAAQFHLLQNCEAKMNAFNHLSEDTMYQKNVIDDLLKEKNHIYQETAINAITEEMLEDYSMVLDSLAKYAAHSSVRLAAFERLSNSSSEFTPEIARYLILNDSVYGVINTALSVLNDIDQEEAISVAESLWSDDSEELLTGLASVFGSSGNPKYMAWFHEKLSSVSIYQSFDLISIYAIYALAADPDNIITSLTPLVNISENVQENLYKKYFSTATLNSVMLQLQNIYSESGNKIFKENFDRLSVLIDGIKKKETNKLLLEKYKEF